MLTAQSKSVREQLGTQMELQGGQDVYMMLMFFRINCKIKKSMGPSNMF